MPPIVGQYVVDVGRPMPGWGGGMTCFVANDLKTGRADRMALLVPPTAPPRAQPLNALTAMPIEGVLSPVAQGPGMGPGGDAAWYIICPAPPGTPLWGPHAPAARPWHEQDLLNQLLRPVAQVLERLQARHVTHRAVRPDNMFRARPGEPVMLGCAWAAPAASLQPAVFEPPYVAMCLPNGRGEGSIADDVYALGVTLLVLSTGRMPMEGMDDATIIRRKLELGSYAALVGDERLSPAVSDLIRGMLAEDPDHRPPPVLLADPAAARARRVAARPARRAQRPLEIGSVAAVNLRTLALALARAPEDGARMLRGGAVDKWLRRSIGDSTNAVQLEELVRARNNDFPAEDRGADSLLTCRAVAILDPLAALTWRGVAIWPDGLGPALAASAGTATDALLTDLVASEGASAWAGMRPERCDPTMLRVEAHQNRMLLRTRGIGGGVARLRYSLNPLLACRSPMVAGRAVVRMTDLLPALEAAAARVELREALPIDLELGAFMAARHEGRIEGDLAQMMDARERPMAALAALRLLAWQQDRQRVANLPQLAAWIGGLVSPLIETWRNRPHRERMTEAFAVLVKAGQLGPMLDLLDDRPALEHDAEGAAEAERLVAAIDAELARLAAGSAARGHTARSVGHEIALGLGMTGLAISLVATVVV